jgi:DNA-binding Lrp family transcriptional regulator
METYKIDLWDKKILNALNQNPRAPYSDIAKKVGLSKEVVNYRVNRLMERGIIKGFVTILGLGNWAYKVVVDFSEISVETEKEVINYLASHPRINWLTPCSGAWDLVFSVMAKDPLHFDKILRDILGKIGSHVQNYAISISTGSDTFGHTYILDSIKEPEKVKRNDSNLIDFDDKDRLIAKILQNNARASLTDISAKTKIPIDTVKYRIKKMEENSVIKRYRLILDSSKLGYHRYEVFLRCVNLSDSVIIKFKEYAKKNPNIEFISKCVGAWDIEFTVHLKTSEDLRKLILEVKEEFGSYIKKFDTVTLFETYNYVCLDIGSE